MTIKEVANQLYDLSVDGWFAREQFTSSAREQFTRRELEQRIRSMFRGEVGFTVPHTMLFEIALPDGWWLFTITHFGKGADEYGYYIPGDSGSGKQALGTVRRWERAERSGKSMTYVYGMRLIGFSPGCQPKDGLIGLADYASSIWDTKRYHDCLEYSRQLTEKELADYELDYLGKVVV